MYALARPQLPAGVPDHEFLVAVNAVDDLGGLRYMGDGDTWYSTGRPSRHGEVFYYMGSDRDFPGDSEIPIDLFREAAKEFLATGGARPTCIPWQADT